MSNSISHFYRDVITYPWSKHIAALAVDKRGPRGTYKNDVIKCIYDGLTPKHRETHGCIVSTVATDALVLKHQAISIHNAD